MAYIRGGIMQIENLNLKRSLILQSFAPLFLLLTIKHLNIDLCWSLLCEFFSVLFSRGIVAFSMAFEHNSFGEFVISIMGICWLFLTIIVACGFNGMQKAGFKAAGEKIEIEEKQSDNGATFLVTYVLPLLTDDVGSFRGLVVFLTMLIMVIMLLISSNTFYQNPVLAAMKYRTFLFKFLNPESDIIHPDRVYVGITHGTVIDEGTVIKRKYISDGVFVIYND